MPYVPAIIDADVYERLRLHPGWGFYGSAARAARHALWLDVAVRSDPLDRRTARRSEPLTYRWLEARRLLDTACIVRAAAALGDDTPDPDDPPDWCALDDEGDIVCASRSRCSCTVRAHP